MANINNFNMAIGSIRNLLLVGECLSKKVETPNKQG
jgi:hypothetical protein